MPDKKGLRENAEFAGYHPLVNLLYFALTVGITMFSLSPWFLAVTFVFSWSYLYLLKGAAGIKLNLTMSIVLMILMVVINMFFNNNGETVLFYINTNRITMEAICFGAASGVMLVSAIVWLACFNVIMTADKVIYLFGKAAPVLGLTLSMIFRFIPLLKSRFAEISTGQKCMGRGHDQGNLIVRARQLLKELSILIAWSLEASIESADSMEARGYGLKGRTSFHLFKFSHRDRAAIIWMLIFGIPVIAGCAMGVTDMYFYPRVLKPDMDFKTAAVLFCYIMMTAAPLAIDITGEMKWKRLDLKM